MKRELRNRRILLTGASRGIGRALAEQLAGLGAKLVLAARSADALNELAQTLAGRGVEVLAVPADITSSEDRQQLLESAVGRFGGLDVLINNAGVASFGHFASSSEE